MSQSDGITCQWFLPDSSVLCHADSRSVILGVIYLNHSFVSGTVFKEGFTVQVVESPECMLLKGIDVLVYWIFCGRPQVMRINI